MDRFGWMLVIATLVLISLCLSGVVYAEPMGQEQFCQAVMADAARVVVLRTEKKITYEQTLASIPAGLPAYQDAELRKMIGLAFQTTDDPMDFAMAIGADCMREPAKYDDAFIHRPGEHHLSQPTIDRAYHDAWKIYQADHMTDIVPEREPRIGFTTAKGICEASKSEQDNGCAIALTAGEKALYPLPGGVDILLDENEDYDSLLGTSILVHEFVHFFQFHNRGPISFCELAVEREHEAYMLQARWLGKHNGGQYVTMVLSVSARQHCPKGQP